MKRLAAPRHWMLSKMGGAWAPRPSTGPHKLAECLPLSLVLRNRLKYALNRREVVMCVMRRQIKVDSKVRTDVNYPCGFMDVIGIEKTNENFRVLYDHKRRFTLVKVKDEEANFKLCKVVKIAKAKKATIGTNPFHNGQAGAIPYMTTHDGRTVRFPDPLIKVGDSVKINIETGKCEGRIPFEVGNTCMVTRGGNTGLVGVLVSKERHPGGFDIVHLKDKRGYAFATRLGNVFVIGEGAKPAITLPKAKGIRLTILEERDNANKPSKSKKKNRD